MPTYETEQDRINERKIKERVELYTGWSLTKTPSFNTIDFYCDDAIIEVRRLKCVFKKYPRVPMTKSKYVKGVQIQKDKKYKHFMFAVWFIDGLFVVDLKSSGYIEKVLVRKEKPFKGDDVCIFIPVKEFMPAADLKEYTEKES